MLVGLVALRRWDVMRSVPLRDSQKKCQFVTLFDNWQQRLTASWPRSRCQPKPNNQAGERFLNLHQIDGRYPVEARIRYER